MSPVRPSKNAAAAPIPPRIMIPAAAAPVPVSPVFSMSMAKPRATTGADTIPVAKEAVPNPELSGGFWSEAPQTTQESSPCGLQWPHERQNRSCMVMPPKHQSPASHPFCTSSIGRLPRLLKSRILLRCEASSTPQGSFPNPFTRSWAGVLGGGRQMRHLAARLPPPSGGICHVSCSASSS